MSTFLTAAQATGCPFNNEVSAYGDSRIANSLLIAGANYNMTTRAIVAWARNLCKQSFRFNFGNADSAHAVGGYTSAQVLTLLQNNIDLDTAATIVVLCSTNDRAAALTAAQSITNMLAIETLVLSKGRLMAWMTEMPRGGSNVLAGSDLQAHLSVVAWLRNRSAIPGVYVADTFGAMTDLTQADARPLTGMMGSDSLHPQALGAYTAALELKKVFDVLFPPRPQLAMGAADIYDATNNPRGSLNANPMLNSTGGTLSAGTATVTNNGIAASWTATYTNATGLSSTLSKVTSGGKDWQQVTFSGTPSVASPSFSFFSTSAIQSLITAGDSLEQTVEWEIDASQTGIQDVTNSASLNGLTRRDLAGDTVNSPVLPTAALSMVSKMGPFTAGSPETGFYKPGVVINFIQSTVVSATVRFRACSVRKIV